MYYHTHQTKDNLTPAPRAQREKTLLQIIDPATNKNILEGIFPDVNPNPNLSLMQSVESITANTTAASTVRKMSDILNKLPTGNFDELVEQAKNLNIKEFSTFDCVIDLIFEKAINEQVILTTYAKFCKALSQWSVKGKETSRLRNLIINKCQTEFERDTSKELNREEREKEIEAETDPEKRIELKATLELEEKRLSERSVGNIRFIGELYKVQFLTSTIIMRILTLLINKDEEALECLCTLLAIVGKTLEKYDNSTIVQGNLNEIFRIMNELANSEGTSNRLRVLLMDVIDLRSNYLISFQEDSKTEVHEEMMQHLLLSTAARKNDIKQKRNRYKRVIDNREMIPNGGWSIASNLRSGPFDSSRLRSNTLINPADNNFEFKAGFSNWARGSSGGVKDQEDESRPCNRFAVLDQFQPQQAENRRNNEMPPRLAPGGSNPSHLQGMIPDEGSSIASKLRRGTFDTSQFWSDAFRNPADNNFEFKAGFSNWARGSSGGVKDQEDESRPCNRFAVLDQFQPQQAENRRNNEMPPRLAPGGSNPSHLQGMIPDEGSSIASKLRRGTFDTSQFWSDAFRNPADNNFEFKAGFSHSARGSSGEDKDQEDESRPCNRFVVLDQFQPQQEENKRNIEMPPRLALCGSNLSHRQSSSSFGRKSMSPISEKDICASTKNISFRVVGENLNELGD